MLLPIHTVCISIILQVSFCLCLLHGCSDCVRPMRFAPYEWTADGTFISPVLAAVNFPNFPNIKLQGDFCVSALQLSHANWRRKHSVHHEKTGSGMKSPAPSAEWPSAQLWPAQALCQGQLLRLSLLPGLCHYRGQRFCLTVHFPFAFRETKYQFPTKELQQEKR